MADLPQDSARLPLNSKNESDDTEKMIGELLVNFRSFDETISRNSVDESELHDDEHPCGDEATALSSSAATDSRHYSNEVSQTSVSVAAVVNGIFGLRRIRQRRNSDLQCEQLPLNTTSATSSTDSKQEKATRIRRWGLRRIPKPIDDDYERQGILNLLHEPLVPPLQGTVAKDDDSGTLPYAATVNRSTHRKEEIDVPPCTLTENDIFDKAKRATIDEEQMRDTVIRGFESAASSFSHETDGSYAPTANPESFEKENETSYGEDFFLNAVENEGNENDDEYDERQSMIVRDSTPKNPARRFVWNVIGRSHNNSELTAKLLESSAKEAKEVHYVVGSDDESEKSTDSPVVNVYDSSNEKLDKLDRQANENPNIYGQRSNQREHNNHRCTSDLQGSNSESGFSDLCPSCTTDDNIVEEDFEAKTYVHSSLRGGWFRPWSKSLGHQDEQQQKRSLLDHNEFESNHKLRRPKMKGIGGGGMADDFASTEQKPCGSFSNILQVYATLSTKRTIARAKYCTDDPMLETHRRNVQEKFICTGDTKLNSMKVATTLDAGKITWSERLSNMATAAVLTPEAFVLDIIDLDDGDESLGFYRNVSVRAEESDADSSCA